MISPKQGIIKISLMRKMHNKISDVMLMHVYAWVWRWLCWQTSTEDTNMKIQSSQLDTRLISTIWEHQQENLLGMKINPQGYKSYLKIFISLWIVHNHVLEGGWGYHNLNSMLNSDWGKTWRTCIRPKTVEDSALRRNEEYIDTNSNHRDQNRSNSKLNSRERRRHY